MSQDKKGYVIGRKGVRLQDRWRRNKTYDALGPFPGFAPAFYRGSVDDISNVIEQTVINFLPNAVDLVGSRLLFAAPYLAATTAASIAATRVFFTSTGTLPNPLVVNVPYYISPNGADAFDVYAEMTLDDVNKVPGALPWENPMPAQKFFQRADKVQFTDQGIGTHTMRSMPMMKSMNNLITGKPAYAMQNPSTDRHKRFEIATDARGDKAVIGRLLIRDPATSAPYSIYGFALDQAPAQGPNFQNESRNKRSTISIAVLSWDETDTYGIYKVPYNPVNVSTANGALTFPAHGIVTGSTARLQVNIGGALPAGYSSSTAYFTYTIDANSISLHLSSTDAATGANPVVPTTQGTGGFIVYLPDRPADVERMRFLAEWRYNGLGNTHTVRTNAVQYGDVNQLTADATLTGANNGGIGAAGRTASGLLSNNGSVMRVRIYVPPGTNMPTRTDTGAPMQSGKYWIRKRPSSSVQVLFYTSEAQCRDDATALLPANTSACIKFTTAAVSGTFRIEQDISRPLNVSTERGADSLNSNKWGPPIGQKGLLTVIADYNDPASSFIRYRYYWNGVLVSDYQSSNGAKGNTGALVQPSDGGATLMNSPGRHVTFEGLVYDLLLGASSDEITEAAIQPVHDWYMKKYGITV